MAGSRNLISINVPEDDVNYSSVDGVLYDKAQKTLIQYPIGNSRTSFVVNDSIKTIASSSFSQCKNLASIIPGKGLQRINSSAFEGCSYLLEIYSMAGKLPELEAFNTKGVFDGVRVSWVRLHGPPGAKSGYRMEGGWRNFKNIIKQAEN